MSDSVKQLYKAQRENLSTVWLELEKQNSLSYRKKTHWIWWVFPINRVGYSDRYKSAINDLSDWTFILQKDDVMTHWIKIINFLTDCVNINSRQVFPDVDHTKLNTFADLWLTEYKEVLTQKRLTKSGRQLVKSFTNFVEAWEKKPQREPFAAQTTTTTTSKTAPKVYSHSAKTATTTTVRKQSLRTNSQGETPQESHDDLSFYVPILMVIGGALLLSMHL